jgi:hypothetical protein
MRQDAVRSFRTKYKNCLFSKNHMGRTESIDTGRTGAGQVWSWTPWVTQGGNFCPMSQASRLLSPFPMTAEVTSAARKLKTARHGGWCSALAEILPVFHGVFAQSLKECMKFTLVTSWYRFVVDPHSLLFLIYIFLNFFTNCCHNKHLHIRTVRRPGTHYIVLVP